MNDSIIKELYVNQNLNNINGIFSIGNVKIFFKLLNKKEYYQEKKAHNLIKKYYNVPKKYFSIKKDNIYVVGYEYYQENQLNQGLLVDYFANHEQITEKFISIIDMYYKVFNKTIEYNQYKNCKILFEDRINTRFKKNINNSVLQAINNQVYTLNGKSTKINLDTIRQEVISFFKKNKCTWNIISQCDPNDLNVCEDGTIFDYTPGGYVPIMAEFATFFWYYLCQSEYLALKYNQKAFQFHNNIYDKLNLVTIKENKLVHNYRKIRKESILMYIEKVVSPILSKINYDNWYYDFKMFLAMKILAVFNFEIMEQKDIILSIAYLQIFFDANINNVQDFIIFLKNWEVCNND